LRIELEHPIVLELPCVSKGATMDDQGIMIEDRIKKLFDTCRSGGFQSFASEEAVKQGLILPVLQILGWNVFDINEVRPEYSSGRGRVDYALLLGSQPAVFLEAKNALATLSGEHQEQLLNYAFHEGVKLAVLTNGATWEFYLPLFSGNWQQRKVYTIDIEQQDIGETASIINNLLNKSAVSSQENQEYAKKLHQSRQRKARISDALPQAWRSLVEKPSDALISLLADETEAICGYKPDDGAVREYLTTASLLSGTSDVSATRAIARERGRRPGVPTGPSGTRARSVTLLGKRKEVNSWVGAIGFICQVMKDRHGQRFEETILSIRAPRTPLFSKNPSDLRAPSEIAGTGFYVENQQTAPKKRELCYRIVEVFGHRQSELQIDYH